jgi:hypothetical protein
MTALLSIRAAWMRSRRLSPFWSVQGCGLLATLEQIFDLFHKRHIDGVGSWNNDPHRIP